MLCFQEFHCQVICFFPTILLNLLVSMNVMHGLASQHLANNPDAPLGQGRFGSLVPVVVSILKQAWEIKD